VLPTPESGLESSQERFEQAAEVSAAAADAAASGMPMMPPAPPLPLVQGTQQAVTDSPVVAADEDVIEKEWVDKAKKIILQTKDDPFERTNKVNELQRDYLKKRYNKDLGASSS
jgi:Txe/YoeB family toxin of Txe-Axe toxin-antitoxin module